MSTTIYSSGKTISSGTIINNAKLDYYQNMYISNGGQANNTTVDRYGSVTISSGGTANNTTVNYYGEMYVYSGGKANHTTMNNFGLMHVSSGGVADSTTFGNGGVIDIFNSGIASNTTVCNNGLMYIEAGGTAKQTTLTTAGIIYVSSGGTAINTTANAGIMYLSGGGKHTGSLHIASGAIVSAFGGATIDFSLAGRSLANDYLINDLSLVKGAPTYTITVSATQSSGTYKLAQGAANFKGSITIGDGSVTYGVITVNGESLEHNEMKYTLTQTGGNLLLDIQPQSTTPGVFIYSSGMLTSYGTKITGTTLDSGCFALISNGGVMNNTTICSGGYTVIRDGGTADNTTVLSGGYVLIYNGGVMNNAAISSGGYTVISDGGTADNTTVLSGGYALIYNGGVMNNTTICSGGRVTVYNGGVANSTTLFGGTGYYDVLFISSGGTAKYTTVYSGGSINISSGGAASATVVNSGGLIYISGGGRAESITLKAGGNIGGFSFAGDKYFNSVENGSATVADNVFISGYGMHIQRGGTVNNINVNSGCRVNISGGGIVNNASVNSGGRMYISSGGMANSTSIDYHGCIYISSEGMANSTTVNSFGSVHISNSGTANGTIINPNGFMFISGGSANRTVLSGVAFMHINGGVANNTVTSGGWIYVSSGTAKHTAISCGGIYVNSGGEAENTVVSNGTVTIFLGGIHRGSLQIESGSVVSAYIGSVVDFTVADRTAADGYLINDLSLVKGAPTYTITVSATQDNGIYKLAQGAENFTGSITIGDGMVDYGTITVNGDDFVHNGVTYSLDKVDGNLTLTVTKQPIASNLQGNVNGVSWNGISDAYTVIYSKDNFATGLQVNTTTKAVDTYGMPAGSYQWKVAAEGEEYKGNNIVSNNSSAAQKLISDADGNMDLFFARSSGTWNAEYFAQRSGTQKLVALNGKNRIQDVFMGSTDANLLVLTDDANGDALFIDDMYSAFGTQARLSQIDEIRAGAGNDIIDLTSNKYAFAGDKLTIFGGAGDDTIWANSGNDIIIGGSGNDSLFGGGGNDTFIFGDNWGKDTVEQLASGKVTLHFENGSLANWNAATQVYSDGVNSVTVTGTADITLKFGADASLPAGVFTDAANEKIFEHKTNGILA